MVKGDQPVSILLLLQSDLLTIHGLISRSESRKHTLTPVSPFRSVKSLNIDYEKLEREIKELGLESLKMIISIRVFIITDEQHKFT